MNVTEEAERQDLALRPTYLSINFKSLFMELLDKLPIVLLCGVLAGLVSFLLYANVIGPDYVSTTKIYVLPQSDESSITYSDLEVGQQLTNDYIEIIQGRTVVEETIGFFGLDESYEAFCKRLTVENQSDTRILSISVEDKDPITARNLVIYLRTTAISAIEDGMSVEGITVIEEANLPTDPETSSLFVAVLAAFVVCCLMVLGICIHYIVIDRIVTADDIEERLGLTVLGSILYEGQEQGISVPWKQTHSSGRSAEDFRSLRANIEFCGAENHVFAFTSCSPGEGKSTISLRVAVELAKTGKNVLFIDGDMRMSVFSEKLGFQEDENTGLSEVLSGREQADDLIYESDINHLSLLLSGKRPPNPAGLLSQKAFRSLLEQVRKGYDYVILDTPPIGSVIDSAIIGQMCDGVVLVIGSNMVSGRMASKAIQQMQRANCNLAGAVLNKVRMSNRTLYGTYGTNKYYYNSYTSSYGEESGNRS
ncbi:MAG: polysaccharide biosynthesis tyrosine autokinase [Clostridiales bacterium]|nr:polysaccharide biosynthesis tyrosine autokinase [Clostridiales bacterium]